MVINHNMSSEFANRLMNIKTADVDQNIARLSSGSRINRAGDDASGLAVSEKMNSQVLGLRRASQNTQDGISFIQTAEGYLQNTQQALGRIRELAVQAANGIYSDEDRQQIQVEVNQLAEEIDRIANSAQFNGMNLLTGRFSPQEGGAQAFLHVGANMDQRIGFQVGRMDTVALGLRGNGSVTPAPAVVPATQDTASVDAAAAASGADVSPEGPAPQPTPVGEMSLSIKDTESANATLGLIDTALFKVLAQRADLGAYQNRLSLTQKGLDISAENLLAAQSRIQDTNMAKEMSEFVKNQILTQASASMIAQSNQKTSAVLRILG